ncbi:hypothetical protein BDZ89DRAFT_1056128 [Hymenopellis radicata]|nr:hypothetical protein BDZ89DRAFT_1056128 [Hymenopellis radicata]
MSSTGLSSPTFTATSTASSFDLISPRSRSSSTYSTRSLAFSEDSDDEIVWSVASSGILSSELSTESSVIYASDDDFVLLEPSQNPPNTHSGLSTPSPRTRPTGASDEDSLVSELDGLSLRATPTRRSKQGHKSRSKRTASTPPAVDSAALPDRPSSVATLTNSSSPAPRKHKRARKPKGSAATGLGSRPIVDDISEGRRLPSVYDDAVRYINSFLTNPDDSHCRLTLLQSLIIELGLATSSLPETMRAAKAYLKSRAFVNIRDYLALRGQGPDALQSAMYPTRSALIKDIRRKRNQASLKWVKQNGLQVLLVPCFH